MILIYHQNKLKGSFGWLWIIRTFWNTIIEIILKKYTIYRSCEEIEIDKYYGHEYFKSLSLKTHLPLNYFRFKNYIFIITFYQ